MKTDMKTAHAEMLSFKRTITDQVSTLQPQLKLQMESVNQELTGLREIKRNLMNNHQLQQQQEMPQQPFVHPLQTQQLLQHQQMQQLWNQQPPGTG